jgi:hypothetical protein
LYTKRSSLQRLIHPNNSAMCQFPDCRGSKEKPAQLSQLREGLSLTHLLSQAWPVHPVLCGVKLENHEGERMSETGGTHIEVAPQLGHGHSRHVWTHLTIS